MKMHHQYRPSCAIYILVQLYKCQDFLTGCVGRSGAGGFEGWWRCWPARSASLCVKRCPQAWSSGPRRAPPRDATRPGPPGTHPGSTGHPAPPAAQAGHLQRQKLSLQIVFGIVNVFFTISIEHMSDKNVITVLHVTLVRRAAR